MTETEKIFLRALAAGIHGRGGAAGLCDELWRDGAFDKVMSLAAHHKVLPLVFDTLCADAERHTARADDESFSRVRRRALRQVMCQTVQSEEFLALLDKFENVALRPLVVKGIVCRQLYPSGDLRPSADEDILVSPSELDACRAILESEGFTTCDSAQLFEQTYSRKNGTLRIELHTSLFPPNSTAYGELNRYFADAHAHAKTVAVGTHTVHTLDCSEHMLYLILHAYKHFVHSGFGIRQLCDITLFAERFDGEIDYAFVAAACRELSADYFAAALFTLCADCLALEPEVSRRILSHFGGRVEFDSLLCDILASGIYGNSEESRLHSGNMTLDAVESDKSGRSARTRHLRLSALFPPIERIRERYPYLKRRPYLLFAAYIERAVSYLKRVSHPLESAEIGSRRVELLREYKIIDREEQR